MQEMLKPLQTRPALFEMRDRFCAVSEPFLEVLCLAHGSPPGSARTRRPDAF